MDARCRAVLGLERLATGSETPDQVRRAIVGDLLSVEAESFPRLVRVQAVASLADVTADLGEVIPNTLLVLTVGERLKDPDSGVQLAAARGLCVIARGPKADASMQEDAIESLESAAEDNSNWLIREEAVESLAGIAAAGTVDPAKRAAVLATVYSYKDDPHIKPAIGSSEVCRVPDEQTLVLPELLKMAADPLADAALRASAISSAVSFDDPSAVGPLVKLASDENDGERQAAIAGLTALHAQDQIPAIAAKTKSP